MQNNAGIVSSIYTARTVLLSQLKDQGYNVESYANFGINEINILYQQSSLDMILEKNETQNEESDEKRVMRAYVRYFTGKLFRPGNIRELVDDLLMNDTITKQDTIIFINSEDSNETIKEFVKQIWEEEGIFIILLNTKRLQFNLLEHVLVPPHRIINDLETKDMMTKYKLKTPSLLPEISRFDPVTVSIGMRPGDICKIQRPSKTSINSVYYRLCVNN
jgi:DNA-directed RNA polymerase subunit H